MTDELRNIAWAALPQEFKKEVVDTFDKLDNSANDETLTRSLKRRYRHQKEALGYLFGYDNLFWNANNPQLTNASKSAKRMCLRDKSKVCDLCHECDIDISQPRY